MLVSSINLAMGRNLGRKEDRSIGIGQRKPKDSAKDLVNWAENLSLGKGEAESSILSDGTIPPPAEK